MSKESTEGPKFGFPSFSFLAAVAFFLIVPFSSAHERHTDWNACEFALDAKVKFEPLNGDFIRADGVPVTGDFVYPLNVVINNLNLQETNVAAKYQGRSVLTIGEGVSGFLPFLLQNGIAAKGLDIWYHTDHFPNNFSGNLMRDYIKKYSDHLVLGSAQKIPLPSSSMDAVFSHMLVNNVSENIQQAIVKDVIRVLKSYGEARIFGFNDEDTSALRKYLDTNYKGKVSYEFKQISYETNFRGNQQSHTLNLLKLRKHTM